METQTTMVTVTTTPMVTQMEIQTAIPMATQMETLM